MVYDSTFFAAAAAGIIMGYVTYYCLVRFQAVDATTLAAVVGLIFAGVAVTFIADKLTPNKDAYATYIVSVLIGMVLFFVLRTFKIGPTITTPS